jgi:hypothetical protein
MTELGDIFAELGISQYLQEFLDQGFDTWDTILDITESDFDALGVKLGHRRKLQRKIANSRGLSSDRALASPSRNTPSDDRLADDHKQGGTKSEGKEGGSGPHGAKRKYRRHPKPDESAPERPPSAYVIFSNKMREDLKRRNLSFTEIAKLVGENWQNLSPGEKEPYEQQAFSAKETYNNELAEYKKTNQYKVYSEYLADFKARQSNQQQGKLTQARTSIIKPIARPLNLLTRKVSDLDAAKRPKLEAHQSTASSGTASSGASVHGDTPTGRMRVESSASNTSQWPTNESQPSPQLTGLKKLSVGAASSQGSPSTTSPTVLPGYRDSIFSGVNQTLAWRDGHRDDNGIPSQQLPRMTNPADARRSSYTGPPVPDPLNLTGSLQHAHRTGQGSGHPPPLLSSESTAGRSSGSSGSTSSSMFYNTPRTPMEPSLDRALPIPALYSQKSSGSFDNAHQLPPLRPPSLSPQTSMLGTQQSPNGTLPNRVFP